MRGFNGGRALWLLAGSDVEREYQEYLQEHNRNVEIWQRRYWRERRQQERLVDGVLTSFVFHRDGQPIGESKIMPSQ